MKKLKWILNIVYVLCIVLPLLFTVLAYKDDLLGVILPPQVMNALSGQSSDQNPLQEIFPDLNVSNINPVYNNDFQFNPNNNSFTVSFNFTNPLNKTVTINNVHLNITDENGVVLGTIDLDNPVTLIPGENSTIAISGTLGQELVNFLQNSGIDLSDPNFNPSSLSSVDFGEGDIHISVTLDVGGVQVQIDDLSELIGGSESGEGGS